MIESLKQRVERGIGESFIQWYNKNNKTNFTFEEFGANPPDLIFRESAMVLPVEISTSYYDNNFSTMKWKSARNDPTVADLWLGINPDTSLINSINERINKKCLSKYDPSTILVIGIHPAITTKMEFEELKKGIIIPRTNPFDAIYTAGRFPSRGRERGGYSCWKLDQ